MEFFDIHVFFFSYGIPYEKILDPPLPGPVMDQN